MHVGQQDANPFPKHPRVLWMNSPLIFISHLLSAWMPFSVLFLKLAGSGKAETNKRPRGVQMSKEVWVRDTWKEQGFKSTYFLGIIIIVKTWQWAVRLLGL